MQHTWERIETHTKYFIGKSDGKTPVGRKRSRRKWDDNIKMDLEEIGCIDVD
jgi:hypothetical protein